MPFLNHRAIAIAGISALTLAGCELSGNKSISTTPSSAPQASSTQGVPKANTATPEERTKTTSSFAQFTDVPMPENAAMDLEKSRVLGSEENWTGWITLESKASAVNMYDFYQSYMPQFGWAKVTTVRGSVITLVYDRDGRVCTITILENGTSQSTVEITIAPKG